MEDLKQAIFIMFLASGIICLIPVTFIGIKINKRIPLSFLINIIFYMLAIFSRALNELILPDNGNNKFKIITSSLCGSLIELSQTFFVFQVCAYKSKILSETPQITERELKKNELLRNIILIILILSSIAKIYTE
jgi:hypothetical protein